MNLHEWREAFWTLLFPAYCCGCRKGVEQRGEWCPACLERCLNIRQLPLRKESPLTEMWVLGDYQGILREKLLAYKFPPYQKNLRFALRTLVEEGLKKVQHFERLDLIIPVPLHSKRKKERGFNQSEELFREVFLGKKSIWKPLLERPKETKTQSLINGIEERRKNLKNAFVLREPFWVSGKRVLLVDDIVTSGATLEEAAKTLKKAGATQIMGLALASGAMVFE